MDDLLNTFFFLCEEAYFNTAAQLIEETWAKLVVLEVGAPPDWIIDDVDQAVADVRSILMAFTNDEDGTEFGDWHWLFRTDRCAFRERAFQLCCDWQERLERDYEQY